MCGICGFTGNFIGDGQTVISRMTQKLVHRGPDDEGFFTVPAVSLGMRRLAIIDVGGGRQPVFNEDGSMAVVYNGEIFNFKELRQELERKGHRFKTHSDTEILPHLYEEEGPDFVKRLNGMFAFALWDAKKELLILARDQIGIKPLYYAVRDNQLIFGSELKALLVHPAIKKEINYEALSHYFFFKHVPAPHTIYQDIHSLQPGELLLFRNGRIQRRFYWKLELGQRRVAEPEATEKILELLRDSVRRQLVADVPVGVYLSGGLDSSVITALASEEAGRTLKTFALGYKNENSEDIVAARKVAKLFKTDHYEYLMDAEELKRDLPEILTAFDEPFAGVTSTYFVTKIISQHVKVALSGDGSDELFGSYRSHRLAAGIEKNDALRIAGAKPWEWRARLLVWNKNEMPLKKCAVDPEELLKEWFLRFRTSDLLNRVLAAEFVTILPDQVLAFVDRLSMAHSVEVRPPFLDPRLVKLVFSLPGRLKISGQEVKYVLKKAAERLLPKDIVYRPKKGFVLPINHWLNTSLRSFVASVLTRKRLERHGLLDWFKVEPLLRIANWNETSIANKIWTLVNFQLWWERYFG